MRSSSTPPYTGTLAPHTPLRPAAAVTGTRASLQSREHRRDLVAVECGRTITDARAVDLVVERPDHRERPPVAARLAHLGGVGRRPPRTRRASCSASCPSTSTRELSSWSRTRRRVTGERDRRRRRPPVRLHAAGRYERSGYDGGCGERVERGLGQAAGRSLGVDQRRGTRSTWRSRSASVQPSSAAMSAATAGAAAADASRASRRARVRRDKHVVDGARHLVARRVHHLGPAVGRDRARAARASARVAASMSASTSRGVAAVARREVRRRGRPSPSPRRRAGARASCGSGAGRRCRVASPTASTVSAAIRR